MKVRRNDTVQVRAGRDRGKRGKVQRVVVKEGRALVEGVNLVKRHRRATATLRQAGIIQQEAPIPISRLMVVCPHCDKGVRVGHRFEEDGRKVRVCRSCNAIIDL